MTEAAIKPLTIALIGVADLDDKVEYLYDPMLYHAFMLMSLNLDEATYQTDKRGIDMTTPLQFDFTERLFIFHKPSSQANITMFLDNDLPPTIDGVIVSLNRHVRIKSEYPLLSAFRETVRQILRSGHPTVFARNHTNVVRQEWTAEVWNEVLQPIDSTVEFIQETFSPNVPIVGYHYGKPSSIQNILTTLLLEINENHFNSSCHLDR